DAELFWMLDNSGEAAEQMRDPEAQDHGEEHANVKEKVHCNRLYLRREANRFLHGESCDSYKRRAAPSLSQGRTLKRGLQTRSGRLGGDGSRTARVRGGQRRRACQKYCAGDS